MPSGRSPSARAGSTGPPLADVGKCGCGAGQARPYTESGKRIRIFPRPSLSARTNACSPAEGLMAAASSWMWGLAFAPDESLLASASLDGSVKLWELGEAGRLRLRQQLLGHTQQVQALAWSPDGAMLASGSWDHTIRLWDAKQGLARVVLQGHRAAVHGLAFTPDSRHLLSGSDDGTLRLWEVERGQCVRVLQGYDACLYDLDWSPDGTRLASAGSDSAVSLWQVESRGGGAPRGVLRGHGWSA